MIPIIGPIASAALDVLRPVLNHFFPDPAQRAQAELAIAQLDWQMLQGQLEINKIEAASSNVFVSGWRPAIGWVGVIGLTWQFILAPLAIYVLAIVNPTITLPVIGGPELISLVVALLGIGAMRSYDKRQGTSK